MLQKEISKHFYTYHNKRTKIKTQRFRRESQKNTPTKKNDDKRTPPPQRNRKKSTRITRRFQGKCFCCYTQGRRQTEWRQRVFHAITKMRVQWPISQVLPSKTTYVFAIQTSSLLQKKQRKKRETAKLRA